MKHNWEYKQLGDICKISSARRVHQADWKDSGVPFYRAREIVKLSENGTVDNELFITQELFDELSKSGVPKADDIMLSAVGTLGATYIVKSTDHFYYKDASVICLGDIRSLRPTFLCYLFDSKIIKHQISRQAKGATVGTITISNASKFHVPVPPMQVQEQIVAELDKINEVIEDCRELLRNLDALAQSLFYDYFGDPVTNPKGWETKPFEDCICKVKYPSKLNTNGYAPSGAYPIVSQEENLVCGYTDRFDCLFTITKPIVVFGDHTRCLKYIDFDFALGADGVKILLPINSICSRYFYYTLLLFKIPSLGYSRHYKLLKELNIPVPPLSLQDKFAARIEQIEAQKKAVEQTIAELQTLLDSRMDYWFND